MEIKFKNLVFEVLDGKIQFKRIGNLTLTGGTIAEIHIAGEDKPQNFGAKLGNSSEGEKLLYDYHEEKNGSLIIYQVSRLLRARTVFTAFENTQTIQEDKIEAANARVDALVAGFTEEAEFDSAELVDIRAGYDGVVYGSAGAAVRQIGYDLKELSQNLEGALGKDIVDGLAYEGT